MADMEVIITLRKTVPDREAGQAAYDLVKQKLADHPEIKVTGSVTNHFTDDS